MGRFLTHCHPLPRAAWPSVAKPLCVLGAPVMPDRPDPGGAHAPSAANPITYPESFLSGHSLSSISCRQISADGCRLRGEP
jgi:hypothetical protein